MIDNIYDSSLMERYVNSLYYALSTMTTCGYGDLHPFSTNERLASMVAMIISSGLFGYIIQDVGRMVSNFNLLASEFREKMVYVE